MEKTRKLSNADIEALVSAGILTADAAAKARSLAIPVTQRGAKSDVDMSAFRRIIQEWGADETGAKKIPVYTLMDIAKLPESALSSSYWSIDGRMERACFETRMRPTIKIERVHKTVKGKDVPTENSTIFLVLTPHTDETLNDRNATINKRAKRKGTPQAVKTLAARQDDADVPEDAEE